MKLIIQDTLCPIYQQIYDQIKEQIINGTLEAGDTLPSIRALAQSLKVSVITVKRAYQDLNKDNLIETIVGKGTFVKKINTTAFKEEAIKEINALFEKVIYLANENSIENKQLENLFGKLLEERDE